MMTQGSYRTYEEWKQDADNGVVVDREGFLPYLWGMETDYDYFERVPFDEFLPYLWGMETSLYPHS